MNLKIFLVFVLTCVLGAIAQPYAVLKMGMSVDLTVGAMLLLALVARGAATPHTYNALQTAVGVGQAQGFMVVILAAYYLIATMQGNPALGLRLETWQVSIWMLIIGSLGILTSALTRNAILRDKSLPWPTGRAAVQVIKTLTAEDGQTEARLQGRVLMVAGGGSGLVAVCRDALGWHLSAPIRSTLMLSLGADMLTGVGFGLLLPLAVGLSSFLGVIFLWNFGHDVALLAAQASGDVVKYKELLAADKPVFKYVVQWMMWPATAMMLGGALASVGRGLLQPHEEAKGEAASRANEAVNNRLVWGGFVLASVALMVIMASWFSIPWWGTALGIGIQPLFVVAGTRVLATTGNGPVSLFANAAQFLYGLVRPEEMRANLAQSHITADTQATGEGSGAAFWVAQRIGGSFAHLLAIQFLALPIGAIIVPLAFQAMVDTYGIGFEQGQLSAPTGLKIASVAIVMAKGVSALPAGALAWSAIALVFGVGCELLAPRFRWLPNTAAFGFALILPTTLSLGLATGSIAAAVWRHFKPETHAKFCDVTGAGILAGESLVGGVLIPALAVLGLL